MKEKEINKKLRTKSKNYLNKTDFLNLIIKYQNKEITNREINTLGKMIISLVNHIAMKPNFNNYSYLHEMKSNAIISVWKGLNSFDINKSVTNKTDNSVFCYFTTTVVRAFIFIINKEKIINERRNEFITEVMEKIEMNNEYKFAKKKFTQEIKPSNSNY